MKKKRFDPRTAAALDALYATLPTVRCQRQCGSACGPVVLTDAEARRLQVTTHTKPRTLPMVGNDPATVRCVYLAPDQRGCRAYAVRPLICRAWGVLKRLSCPRGCVPDRWLSDAEFLDIALQVERLGGGRILRTGPDGIYQEGQEAFAQLEAAQAAGATRLPAAQVEAEAELTRGLRAIHGGRILGAFGGDPVRPYSPSSAGQEPRHATTGDGDKD